MARKIKIKWSASRYRYGRDDAIRVRIETVCAEGMAEKIFAYRMLPKSPPSGSERGYFSHICSPADIEDFPEDEPIPTHVPKWFRLDYVDVMVRSETEAAAFITDVRSDVRRLKLSLDTTDTIFPQGTDDFESGIVCSSVSSAGLVSSSSSSASSLSLGPLKSLKSTGSFEQNVGYGQIWTTIGTGAGSPIGSSDSLDALNRNESRVTLFCNLVSKMLLIQGYDFDDLPENAVLQGIIARLVARDSTLLGSSISSAPAGSVSSSSSAEAPNGPRLFFLRLYDPDLGLVGDDKSNNDVIFGPDWQNFVFGGDDDLWNAGISVKTLRERGDFGVGLVVGVDDTIDEATVDVDGVELEVFYR